MTSRSSSAWFSSPSCRNSHLSFALRVVEGFGGHRRGTHETTINDHERGRALPCGTRLCANRERPGTVEQATEGGATQQFSAGGSITGASAFEPAAARPGQPGTTACIRRSLFQRPDTLEPESEPEPGAAA